MKRDSTEWCRNRCWLDPKVGGDGVEFSRHPCVTKVSQRGFSRQKGPAVLLLPASPAQARCECAMRLPVASSGGASPILAAPHHHAAVLQQTQHRQRTPTNRFSKALAFEARCCQSPPVSRVLGNSRGHLRNANPASAGLEGTLPDSMCNKQAIPQSTRLCSRRTGMMILLTPHPHPLCQ